MKWLIAAYIIMAGGFTALIAYLGHDENHLE